MRVSKHLKSCTNFKNINAFNDTPNNGQKSDILRSQILYEFGGVYLDTDFILVKTFEELLDLDLQKED
jgi:mannosyltransferase OCH1-like enzyme